MTKIGKADWTEWKPDALARTCTLYKCEGCWETPFAKPCRKWHFKLVLNLYRVVDLIRR